ncbi:MAG TPA: mersacidin/lichenicidin family type 2 lantibiotic [Thermoanaerobaculia bacterium]|jgi:mersacidin/lichenicidin family type 2 lantibiotic|nr:mersacidin/lichenicidin family type 2 lantibiotic [Thermoanaerobaculia bacterium]
MNKTDVIRAWKDPLYRASLSAEERTQLPDHPSAAVELADEQLKMTSGAALTTAMQCTEYTFNNFRSCCPR